jgi:Protein of unknown function (DUF4019)
MRAAQGRFTRAVLANVVSRGATVAPGRGRSRQRQMPNLLTSIDAGRRALRSCTLKAMPGIALLAVWLFACSSDGASETRETYDYLVSPDGQRFRVITAGPVVRGAHDKKLGVRISYVSQAESPADLLAHADTLVRAFGPELQLASEEALLVRARFGAATMSLATAKAARYDLEYRLREGEYVRGESSARLPPPPLAGTRIDDDPAFPFRAERLNEAVVAGSAWLALVDGDDLSALREAMAPSLHAKLRDDDEFGELLAQRRHAGGTQSRRELYRMQQRSTAKDRRPGDDARVVYECIMSSGQRMVERLVLARNATRWQITGYAFQPVPH